MRILLSIFILLCIAVVTVLGFRGSLSEKPPLEVFPDMDRQAKYKPQAENDFFTDRRNDRLPPAHTVRRGDALDRGAVFSADFDGSVTGDDAFRLGKNPDGSHVERIPVPVDHAFIELGREKYGIFCAVCHGAAGDGNGVTKSYGILATSYHDDRLRGVPDGEIYDVISNGKGLMYGLKDRLSPEERWAVVLYLRALQRSQNASAGDLPPGKDKELGL
jgi:hypothetical protein